MNTTRVRLRSPGVRGPVRRLANHRDRLLHVLSLLLILWWLGPIALAAEPTRPTEAQIKAAYLYNFGKFVRWPSDRVSNPDALEMCVLGRDPFGSVLDATVAGESVDSKKITVRRVGKIQDAATCSILFIGSSDENQLGGILAASEHFGLLTVSDIPRFAERGGIIGFVIQQNRVRFEVNRRAAEQSHLALSSELLKVASRVIDNSAPPGPK